MKKLMAIAVAVVLVITAFAMVGPVSAGPPANPAVFEATIVPAPWSVETLTKGEFYVRADGSGKVEVEGATPGNITYDVYLGQLTSTPSFDYGTPVTPPNWIWLGQLVTDANGDGVLSVGPITGPWAGPVLRIAVIVGGKPFTKFTSGFNLP